ncbi:MAG: VCBS repeat-containing protein [Gammaproteobacteria bacterium]|nr:VCBS repeat-containing protein [Gammaproteobacteria bacterium]
MKDKIGLVGCCMLLSMQTTHAQVTVGDAATSAQSEDGRYISWREHIIDGPDVSGTAISGSDGLVMGDIDGDGYEDIVSVHESDTEYASDLPDPDFVPPPAGHVRIAFASDNPDRWFNITIAEGEDAPAPEDAALADLNQDGFLDVVVAAELSHLIYLQNPGINSRTESWPRLILPMTQDRGSYIRVFIADFNNDGVPEVTAPNKGAQRPTPEDFARSTPVSLFEFNGSPLSGNSWTETELGHYSIPQNAEPVDLDGDGDLDIMVGTRGEARLIFFENLGTDELSFEEHAIGINRANMAGFNLEYADLNNDGRLDIIGAAGGGLSWIEQPERIDDAWNAHFIGTFSPDSMTGFEIADINGDGHMDVMAGSYSRGPRGRDGDVTKDDRLGRIGWFENPGDAKQGWTRHDISRRKRGMFDKFIARDVDHDGDMDFLGTRGNSAPFDGVFWLEQVRTSTPVAAFQNARSLDSEEMPLP